MPRQWLAASPFIAILVACAPQKVELSLLRPVSDSIRAGTAKCYSIALARDQTAQLSLEQRDINLSLQAQGIENDSSEWGLESAYISTTNAARVPVCVWAEAKKSRGGRFRLRVLTIRPRRPDDVLTVRAATLEASGRRALAERMATSLPVALEHLRDAAALWTEFGDPLRAGNTLLAYGIANERLDNYREADAAYTRACDILEKAGDRPAYLSARKTWMNLGGRIGEDRGSATDLESMLTEAKAIGDQRSILRFTGSLARAVANANDWQHARELKQATLQLARDLGDKTLESEVLGNLSGFEVQRGNLPAALHLARASLQLAQDAGDVSSEIAITGFIADIHGLLGDPEREAPILRRLAAAHAQRGDFTAWASATTRLADTERRRGNVPDSLALLLDLHRQMDRFYRSDSHSGVYFTNPGAAAFSSTVAQLGLFPGYVRQAFWLVDSQRGRFYLRDTRDRTRELQRNLPNDTLFIEYVDGLIAGGPAVMWIVDGQSIVIAKSAAYSRSAEDLKQVAAQLPDPNLNAEASLAARIRLGELLLGPLQGRIRGKKLVIVPDEAFAHIPFALLPDPDHTDGSLLGAHHDVTYAPSGQSVAASIERPAKSFEIDFLIAADPVTSRFDSRLPVRHAAPPQSAAWTSTARAAGVLDERNQLPRLAYAMSEVQGIRSGVGNRGVTALLGFDVTPARVLEHLPRARLAHITSHGLVDLEKPMASGLVFSFWDRQGAARDGFLPFDQISESRTNSELVTLGACETAIGRVIAKNGIPSLANAFLRAGARRVISSAWKVDDAATAELMGQFYRNLLSSAHATPARALWQAQMYIAAQPRWGRPYYWAGYSLSGDWRPL